MSDPDAARDGGKNAEQRSVGAKPDGNEGVKAGATAAERFPRSVRLRKRSQFLEVQARGTRVHTPHFVLLVLPMARQNPQERAQALGVTATRKLGDAVTRNRVKRLLREVFRRNRELFPPDCAVVAVARAGAPGLDYAAVRAEIAGARGGLERAARRGQAATGSGAEAQTAPTRTPSSPGRSR